MTIETDIIEIIKRLFDRGADGIIKFYMCISNRPFPEAGQMSIQKWIHV